MSLNRHSTSALKLLFFSSLLNWKILRSQESRRKKLFFPSDCVCVCVCEWLLRFWISQSWVIKRFLISTSNYVLSCLCSKCVNCPMHCFFPCRLSCNCWQELHYIRKLLMVSSTIGPVPVPTLHYTTLHSKTKNWIQI